MTIHRPRLWRIAPHDESCVRRLSAALEVPFLVAQVLVARGYTARDQARAFLMGTLMDLHEPSLLPGVEEAADLILAAVQARRRITIYGDYDVDGVTATSLLWQCLRLAGASVDYYIPDRLEEGYGLNCDALRRLHREDPNRLVVSVDCGIASTEEADFCRELGLDLIVTDHHEFGADLPRARALVHPRLPGGAYPFADLCGVAVAFKLAWAICQRLGDGRRASPQMREFLRGAVGLVALGTVADVMPLKDENRIFVRYGLASLAQRSGLGVKALMQAAGLEPKGPLQAEDIAFALAPRLNAAGRLGQARLAVELLTTDNPDRALRLAAYLEQLNRDRQTLERRLFKEAKELVNAHPEWKERGALVLAKRGWHAGVIGIVASRVAEHFEKPTILISLPPAEGLGQGSGRTYGEV
ncbi:MAG: single-stranded-DNA-specific exonuclease RecJ, partial [Planctomycetes bacterium]|nr:single-stranded-DNA-specific exonuclease RecJ [Planctomycetota bacterium]